MAWPALVFIESPTIFVVFPRSAVVELCSNSQSKLFSPFQRIPDLLGFKFLSFLKNHYFKSAKDFQNFPLAGLLMFLSLSC